MANPAHTMPNTRALKEFGVPSPKKTQKQLKTLFWEPWKFLLEKNINDDKKTK